MSKRGVYSISPMRPFKKKHEMPSSKEYYAMSHKNSINKPAMSLKANVIRHRAISGVSRDF
jgi:hypothetical protein